MKIIAATKPVRTTKTGLFHNPSTGSMSREPIIGRLTVVCQGDDAPRFTRMQHLNPFTGQWETRLGATTACEVTVQTILDAAQGAP